ncbi:hypothetical protein Cni_G24092 [Canna indica]|uniref:SPT2 chromatin protein n=1 Tax=Canna indica TaxID=4628 RepID=A0AAQ3KZL3_9LILI|nr:hypothetical protein Cni_G24092 [Canna indica]
MFGSAQRKKSFHHRPEEYDEYEEDYDEYEEEASEHDEGEEPETPKPTKEEQDFLKLREELKDMIRKNLKKQTTNAIGHSQSQEKKRAPASGTFGSFFGPSQTVIASRVIEESKSIRETKHIMANMSNSAPKKRDTTSSGGTKSNHQHHQQPKVVKEYKNKAQTLKDMRDYSFLLSDDADLPTEKEQTTSRGPSASKSDGRPAQTTSKSKLSIGKPAKLPSIANGLKNTYSSKHHLQRKIGLANEALANRPRPALAEARKFSSTAVGNTSGKPLGSNTLQRKVPAQLAGVKRPPNKVVNDPRLKKDLSTAKPHSALQKRPTQLEQKRPAQLEQKRPAQLEQKRPAQLEQKRPIQLEQKRPTQRQDQVRKIVKQPIPSQKSQPSKQNLSRHNLDARPKKRPAGRDLSDEEDVDYRSLIRGMFRYNPNKYAGDDEDDSDMEVGFDMIQKEERISSKIARKEDEEQLRLIEEEEERERRMRMKKKQRRG